MLCRLRNLTLIFELKMSLKKQKENRMGTEKKKCGRWKSGESGNPRGRPPGVGEITRLRESIAEHLPEIISQMVIKAKAGDAQAARLLLERVLPPVKPIEQTVALSIPIGKGITAQGLAIVRAVADGKIAPSQAATLLTGLGALSRMKEVDELERRIIQLEEVNHGK